MTIAYHNTLYQKMAVTKLLFLISCKPGRKLPRKVAKDARRIILKMTLRGTNKLTDMLLLDSKRCVHLIEFRTFIC